MRQYWAPLFLKTLSAATITRAIELVDGLAEQDSAVSDCTYLIFELLASVRSSPSFQRPLYIAGC